MNIIEKDICRSEFYWQTSSAYTSSGAIRNMNLYLLYTSVIRNVSWRIFKRVGYIGFPTLFINKLQSPLPNTHTHTPLIAWIRYSQRCSHKQEILNTIVTCNKLWKTSKIKIIKGHHRSISLREYFKKRNTTETWARKEKQTQQWNMLVCTKSSD